MLQLECFPASTPLPASLPVALPQTALPQARRAAMLQLNGLIGYLAPTQRFCRDFTFGDPLQARKERKEKGISWKGVVCLFKVMDSNAPTTLGSNASHARAGSWVTLPTPVSAQSGLGVTSSPPMQARLLGPQRSQQAKIAKQVNQPKPTSNLGRNQRKK
jgi:hypothetical protein